MAESTIEQKEKIPVLEVFANRARREILSFVLTEMAEDNEWYRTGEIASEIDVSRESVRKAFPMFVAYGVLDVKGADANIPHYRVADTDVIDLLVSYEGDPDTYSLFELCHFTGARRLVQFFLTRADPEESYSFNAISQSGIVGAQTAAKHIDTLLEAGVVEPTAGKRATRYTIATDADIVGFLYHLNETIYETYQQRA